jgi:uncharacterized protein
MQNKNIIITGASSGIGADILRLAAENGNKIFAVARNIDKIPSLPGVKSFSCDVSVKENIDKMFVAAIEYLGEIDYFFANAGFAYYEIIENADWQHNEAIFNTNVFSVFYSIQKLKEIKKDKAFNFIVTASAISHLPYPGFALYSATKFALRGFADAYRYELGHNQKLTMVYPVATYTQFFNVASADTMPWPRQKSITVAKAALRGAEKGKKHVYPSCLFRMGIFLNGIFPVYRMVQKMEGKKLRKKYNL